MDMSKVNDGGSDVGAIRPQFGTANPRGGIRSANASELRPPPQFSGRDAESLSLREGVVVTADDSAADLLMALGDLSKDLDVEAKRVVELTRDGNELRGRISQLELEIQTLTKENGTISERMQTAAAELAQAGSDKSSLRECLEYLGDQLDANGAEMRELRDSKDRLEGENLRLTEELNSLADRRNALEAEVNGLRGTIANQKGTNDDIVGKLRDSLSEMAVAISEERHKNESAGERIASLEEKLQASDAILEGAIHDAEVKLKGVLNPHGGTVEGIQRLRRESEMSPANQARNTISLLLNKIAKLKSNQRREMRTKEAENERFRAQAADAERRIRDLEAENEQLRDQAWGGVIASPPEAESSLRSNRPPD
ncbi:MAG: hypothetical protein LBD33_01190 [Puniceicoccales bacterium]|jgi:peptidoglycan hydrolase CwlO-like protein|nr:hypothetical protein [Puniceicoccales bacterium]